MDWVMDISGSESLCTAANVFVGISTAPLVIRPYLETMTRSEVMLMLVGGMATVAGGPMAAYAGMGADAGHLMAASLMSAPAAVVIAKIMVPETETSVTKGEVKIDVAVDDTNVLDAACRGAGEGLMLALNVAAMLIAFIALVHMLNWFLSPLPDVAGEPLTLQRVLGWLLAPLAWLMGVPWQDAPIVGTLIGEKTVFNEFVGYMSLTQTYADELSPRSFTIATYALCGFANFGSIAVMIGGIGGLVPSRRPDLARYGLRSMIGGALAAFMTASVAGILL
jgi:CNT family concentrative nucleoside transporter